MKFEELAKIVLSEMSSGVFRFVHYTCREVLLLTSGMSALLYSYGHGSYALSLEDLFLNRSGRLKAVDKA